MKTLQAIKVAALVVVVASGVASMFLHGVAWVPVLTAVSLTLWTNSSK